MKFGGVFRLFFSGFVVNDSLRLRMSENRLFLGISRIWICMWSLRLHIKGVFPLRTGAPVSGQVGLAVIAALKG